MTMNREYSSKYALYSGKVHSVTQSLQKTIFIIGIPAAFFIVLVAIVS